MKKLYSMFFTCMLLNLFCAHQASAMLRLGRQPLRQVVRQNPNQVSTMLRFGYPKPNTGMRRFCTDAKGEGAQIDKLQELINVQKAQVAAKMLHRNHIACGWLGFTEEHFSVQGLSDEARERALQYLEEFSKSLPKK